MDKKTILVGMSGGVDSSVAVLLLKNEGHAVSGATMKLFASDDLCGVDLRTCCALTDVEDARRVAEKIGIDHHVFQFREEFRREVILRFCRSYANGETPNPCIDCNQYVKFPYLLKRARQLGFSHIAGGHYARVSFREGRWQLRRGLDKTKDQSYVLYPLTQDELSASLFPLGEMTKAEIRKIAREYDLVNAEKPDSQDICFVPDGDYGQFLVEKEGVVSPPGDIVLPDDTILGRHRGLIHYTIGQRRGLGLAFAHPLFVLEKDLRRNRLIVGGDDALWNNQFRVRYINWVSVAPPEIEIRAAIMCRYRDRETMGTIYPEAGDMATVALDAPKRAITPGQAAVFYDGDIVLGGGVIV